MRPYSYIAIFAAAVLAVCGCQNELELDSRVDGISFNPFIDGVTNTEMTKASAFRSADGSVEIPAWLTVSDGISVMPDDARHAELDSASDPSRHAELDSASDEIAGQARNDEASPATKGDQINTTGSSTALANFASAIDNTFYVTAWKGSPAARFVPSSGTGTYEAVTYSSSKWSTIDTKWEGTDDNATFFAYANCPSSSSVAKVTNTSSSVQTLNYYAVPTDASLQKDILLGYYYGDGTPETTDKTCTADLQFHHPLTAVRFKKGSFSGTVKFKAIYLDGVYKNGTATMTGSGATSTIAWNTASSSKQEVCQEGSQYLAVGTSDNIIGDTFLLIPQTITTSAPVTVTILAEIDGTVHPLTATLGAVSWAAGKTYTYTLGYNSKTFILTGPDDYAFFGTAATSDNSQTIDCYLLDESTSTKTAGDYYLEYSTDGGTSYSTTSPDWVTVSVGNGTNGEDRTLTVGVTELTAYTETGVAAALKSYPEKTNFDLSKFNSATGQACETSTANTYIVNAPGTYRFPVVYGNALKNGETNSKAYNPQTGSNPTTMNASGSSGYNYYLRYFLDYKDQTITQPYILHSKTGQYTVGTLWSDIQNLVTNVALEGSGDDAYISFTVAKSTINEGNAVIYLADPSGDIVWSWQIWVSAVDASKTIPIKNLAGVSHDFMTYHLGWESNVNAVILLPTPRTVKVRMVMTYDGNVKDSKEFNVTQSGIGSYKDPTDGRCTYYQWGRKDPFIPGGCRTVYNIKSGVSPLVSTTFNSNTFQSIPVQHATQSQQGVTIGATIQHPWIHYCSYWMAPTKYDITNLWNGNATSRNYTGETLKTVYDPSPVGFVVPPSDAYTAFTVDGLSNNDDLDKINADMTAGFDPASATGTGWRFYTQGWKTGPTVSFTIKGNRFSQDGIWANTIGADKTTTEDQGRLWTSGPTTVSESSNVVAIGLIYHHTWVKPKQTLDEADGTSIRCSKEK